MRVAIIGGGAAGFFASFSVKKHHPEAFVELHEATSKVLSKVKISGGGRCNVTNGCREIKDFCLNYPRGSKKMRSILYSFSARDTIAWFERRNVLLKEEQDGRVFPKLDSSQVVIDCFIQECERKDIQLRLKSKVIRIENEGSEWKLGIKGVEQPVKFDKLIIASGGNPKLESFNWLECLGHIIVPPVPSLFTFNIPENKVTELMGVSVPNSIVKIIGTKIKTEGGLMITHWGMSGPAILKASSFGARLLNEKGYSFEVQVNWVGVTNTENLFETLSDFVQSNPKKKVETQNPFLLPNRLWKFLLNKSEIEEGKRWIEIGVKKERKLIDLLVSDSYKVKGKTTFKEEFVTCGGVSLEDIDFKTMKSKRCPNLYFAGEVLDIDGLTGGFNFQAAWSTAFVSGKLMD